MWKNASPDDNFYCLNSSFTSISQQCVQCIATNDAYKGNERGGTMMAYQRYFVWNIYYIIIQEAFQILSL